MAKKQKKHIRIVRKKSSRSKTRWIVPALIGIAICILIGFLAYSVISFKQSTYEAQGFITCDEGNTVCEESKHIHADIEVSICGKAIIFPKEKGNTDKQHTHKERNKIHWHARIPVDPQEYATYIDPSPRTLGAFMQQMELSIPATCGSLNRAQTRVEVNGATHNDGMSYVWQDGDIIHVIVE